MKKNELQLILRLVATVISAILGILGGENSANEK
jgi:hypothetical protein